MNDMANTTGGGREFVSTFAAPEPEILDPQVRAKIFEAAADAADKALKDLQENSEIIEATVRHSVDAIVRERFFEYLADEITTAIYNLSDEEKKAVARHMNAVLEARTDTFMNYINTNQPIERGAGLSADSGPERRQPIAGATDFVALRKRVVKSASLISGYFNDLLQSKAFEIEAKPVRRRSHSSTSFSSVQAVSLSLLALAIGIGVLQIDRKDVKDLMTKIDILPENLSGPILDNGRRNNFVFDRE